MIVFEAVRVDNPDNLPELHIVTKESPSSIYNNAINSTQIAVRFEQNRYPSHLRKLYFNQAENYWNKYRQSLIADNPNTDPAEINLHVDNIREAMYGQLRFRGLNISRVKDINPELHNLLLNLDIHALCLANPTLSHNYLHSSERLTQYYIPGLKDFLKEFSKSLKPETTASLNNLVSNLQITANTLDIAIKRIEGVIESSYFGKSSLVIQREYNTVKLNQILSDLEYELITIALTINSESKEL